MAKRKPRPKRKRPGKAAETPETAQQSAEFGNAEARREALALHLAKGLAVAQAATAAGVAVRTAFEWRADPAFAARVKELRGELFAQAVGILASVNGLAAAKIGCLIQSDDEKVALAAVKATLELGRSLRETEDLQERLAELEERLRAREGDGK